MRLSKALKEKMMDLRLRDKLIGEGKLTKADVEKFLKDLEDQSDNVAHTAGHKQVTEAE